ncbi:hypothetical protein COCNU_scaffold023065G000020 [Cocos nucifera]|nr:hypothetical protein [Cocos nucifera]
MKSSLRKLRGFALHRHDSKEKREHHPRAHQDELLQASQDMLDMRSCYDSLLSAAAAAANSAFGILLNVIFYLSYPGGI